MNRLVGMGHKAGEDMQRDETTEPDKGALSTEDLAGAQQASGEEPTTTPEEGERAPVYPGEAQSVEARASEGAPPAKEEGEAEEEGKAEKEGKAEEPAASERTTAAEEDQPLLGAKDQEFRARWQEIQTKFVDDPQDAVREADALVAECMQTLAATFAQHKQELEGQWQEGRDVATEDLRVALQRYRSFFNRLLHT